MSLFVKTRMKKTIQHTSIKKLVSRLLPPVCVLLVLFWLDLAFDIKEQDQIEHIAIEFLIYVVLIYVAYVAFVFYHLGRQALDTASKNIDATTHKLADAQQKNKQLQDGINASMQQAFIDWKLTIAEVDVAVLIVKGFSLVEIAHLRSTSERTVRDQAASIYHKAGLKNRIELMAYFVEDLL